jgi:hypothetical protein
MKKYIFYQTNKTFGMCSLDKREKYSYKKNIIPIRVAILEIRNEAVDMLLDIFIDDKLQFIDIIQEELNQNFTTLYMN